MTTRPPVDTKKLRDFAAVAVGLGSRADEFRTLLESAADELEEHRLTEGHRAEELANAIDNVNRARELDERRQGLAPDLSVILYEPRGMGAVCRACGTAAEGTAATTLAHHARCPAAVIFGRMGAEITRLRSARPFLVTLTKEEDGLWTAVTSMPGLAADVDIAPLLNGDGAWPTAVATQAERAEAAARFITIQRLVDADQEQIVPLLEQLFSRSIA